MRHILIFSFALLTLSNPLSIRAEQKQKTEFCKCNPCKCDPCLCGIKCECFKSENGCQNPACKCTQGQECICVSAEKKCCTKDA